MGDAKDSNTQKPTQGSTSAPVIPPVPSTKSYEKPCEAAETREEHDLCQQWRMAQKTEELATIAERQNQIAERQTKIIEYQTWIIIAETVLLLIATLAAVGAARWAKQAVNETKNATDIQETAAKDAKAAADEANALSRKAGEVTADTAKRQLRAYVGAKDAQFTMTDDGELSYRIRYMNYGQTPALELVPRTSFTATPLPLRGSLPTDADPDQRKSIGVLWPGMPVTSTGTMLAPGPQKPAQFTPEYRDDIAAGRAAIFLHGEITYRDVFGQPQTTTFRLMYVGPWGGQRPLEVCEEGNSAT